MRNESGRERREARRAGREPKIEEQPSNLILQKGSPCCKGNRQPPRTIAAGQG